MIGTHLLTYFCGRVVDGESDCFMFMYMLIMFMFAVVFCVCSSVCVCVVQIDSENITHSCHA